MKYNECLMNLKELEIYFSKLKTKVNNASGKIALENNTYYEVVNDIDYALEKLRKIHKFMKFNNNLIRFLELEWKK